MGTARRPRPISRIATYTLFDELRQRSFVVMLAVCAGLVFLVRGCYSGNYVVNGQALGQAAVVAAVSGAAFQVVAVLAMLIAALFSMRAFRRDRDAGMQSSVLSRPITRRQYVLGKVAGLWALSAVFMLALQAVVFIVTAVYARVVMPGYIIASLLCSVDLLFVVVAVLLLSLLMPETAAFLLTVGIGVAGLVLDWINALDGSGLFRTVTGLSRSDLTLGKVLYYAWPKVAAMQRFASAFIEGGHPVGAPSVYPLFNILVYCLILAGLLVLRFRKEEIV